MNKKDDINVPPSHRKKKDKKLQKERSAGILLHITSLPSPFGIGDLGPQAKAFADFLFNAGQTYWQILPLNPTDQAQGHSPYSAFSAMASNTLLISPELLCEMGLLHQNEIDNHSIQSKNIVDFKHATSIKDLLFDKAYLRFIEINNKSFLTLYEKFCQDEQAWLNDFAIFMALKNFYKGAPWYEWPIEHKLKKEASIISFTSEHLNFINKTKWLQFIFDLQWSQLKTYCNSLSIRIIGDMPIYVGYDSTDVWSDRHIFDLDKEGNRIGIAGVPPDYFNENGQVWGMPVFNWEANKQQKYTWWVSRLKRNIRLYDVLRLDHFRAFSNYFVIPVTENTGKNGIWKEGPGQEFFKHLQKELGGLPFIAEDLGEVNEEVFILRDQFALPGMKILQFAFDSYMPQSIHIPHNYELNFVVYTGTHDNNTTLGWFRKDTDSKTRKRISSYLGVKVNENNIAFQLNKMAYSSVAKICIIPMQDILGLDEASRMNDPGGGSKSWLWRLLPGYKTEKLEKQILNLVLTYNRAGKSVSVKV